MQYLKTNEARFISRPNRFIAQVEFDGKRKLSNGSGQGIRRQMAGYK